jgi:TonB family protein
MLQPRQLIDVSATYGQEIAELRDFLQKADCVPGTAETLHVIADRLQQDRSFHRDLTSYLWVVIDSRRQNIGYADLLGMLAIAAAGTRFATEADEDDAHALLRFVMEARQSLDGAGKLKETPAASPRASVPLPAAEPVELNVLHQQVMRHPQDRPLPRTFPSLETEDRGSSRRRLIVIAACALTAVVALSGLATHYLSTPDKAVSRAPATAVATGTPASTLSKESAEADLRSEAAPAAAVPPPAATKRSTRAARPAFHAHGSRQPPATKPSVSSQAPMSPSRITTAAAATPPPPVFSPSLVSRSAPAPVPSIKNVPKVTSSTVPGLSSSTDSSTPDLSNTVKGRQSPGLHRRTPEEQTELVAEARPPEIAPFKNRPADASSTPIGTVRAVSLGTNAANVLYGPTPAYPSAASVAHVQGEVKLQANVDRDGNVASVRVISGPPLLREAALDAAQRWRYRPNTSDGEPIPMSAITVFEFQLP